MTVTVTSKDFGYAVKFLKKCGYKFDAATKTWSGTRDISFIVDGGYVVPVVAKTVCLTNEDMVHNIEG